MGKGLALLGLPLLIACGGRTERSLDFDGAPGSSSDYGGSGFVDQRPEQRITLPGDDLGVTPPAGTEPEPITELPVCTVPSASKPTARLPATSPVMSGAATVLGAT